VLFLVEVVGANSVLSDPIKIPVAPLSKFVPVTVKVYYASASFMEVGVIEVIVGVLNGSITSLFNKIDPLTLNEPDNIVVPEKDGSVIFIFLYISYK